jgi:hypothetical protein
MHGPEYVKAVLGDVPAKNLLRLASFQGGIRKISKEDYNNILNILPSKNLLSFVDLQKFLLEEMQMQANYQPIMIRTLLQSGGKATKDDIAANNIIHNTYHKQLGQICYCFSHILLWSLKKSSYKSDNSYST